MMDYVDPKNLTDEKWQAEFDGLVAYHAAWRKIFALQTMPVAKAPLKPAIFEFFQAE
jgi:hypothetical protein